MNGMVWTVEDTVVYNPLAGRLPAPSEGQPLNGTIAYSLAQTQLREAALAQYSSAELDHPTPETSQWVERRAGEIIRSLTDASLSTRGCPAFDQPDEAVAQSLLNDIFGMGPLEALLRLPDVEDIAINGPEDIWYRTSGRWEKSDARYADSQTLLLTLNRAIVHTGRQAGPLTPIVDSTLRSGHRINIVTDPLADPWPTASIRLHRGRSLLMENLVAAGGEEFSLQRPARLPDYFPADNGQGTFSALSATFLHMAVVAGFNILVVGSTGVGKTTVLGALGRLIPFDRRVIVIEDTRELRLRSTLEGRAENCVYFTTRPESVEGVPAISQDALVRAALRQRPDALTVGEARGAEVFDLLKALWTGHRNGLTSIHADSLEDVANRIRMMLQEARFQTAVSETTVALWIARAFHLGISIKMTETGRRYIEEIAEFTGGIEGNVPVRTALFRYDHSARRLRCTGHRLHGAHENMLRQAGFSYDTVVAAASERGEHE